VKADNVIYRHSIPSHLDTAPALTQCHVKTPSGLVDVYVQLSREPEKPRWIYIDSFNEHLSTYKIKKLIEKRLLTQDRDC